MRAAGALAAAGMVGCVPPAASAPDLAQTLAETLPGDRPACALALTLDDTLRGHLECSGFEPGQAVRPELAAHAAAGPSAGPAVADLRLVGSSGEHLSQARRGWEVPPDGRWSARYTLVPRPDTPRDLRVTPAWTLGRGYDVVVADWRTPRLAGVRFVLPDGFAAAVAFDGRPAVQDVLEGWFLLSDAEPAVLRTGGRTVRWVAAPGTPVPSGFAEALEAPFAEAVALLGDVPGDDFLFVLRPREIEGEPGGDSSRRSARIVPWPTAGDEAAQLVGTLVHEYVHRLIPGRIHERVVRPLAGLDIPDDARWFSEGFAEWTTRRILGRAGLLDARATLQRLAEAAGADDRSLIEAGRAASTDPAADALCYSGGALLAAWLDLALEQTDPGGDPFFELMRSLVEGEIDVPLRSATVRSALVASSAVPAPLVEELDRYLQTGARPDPVALLDALPPHVASAWWASVPPHPGR